jgi:glycosyltransferase involved in cell wall biosynthesis
MRKLHVMSVLNRYLSRGGEDEVFESEASMLQARGVRVTSVSVRMSNPDNVISKATLGLQSVWSHQWLSRLGETLIKERPDVVHVHNSFPRMSPAIYYACQRAGVPVVQTLHNYRLICPGALLFRDGGVCEDCLGGKVWRGVRHGCYRGSRAQTSAVALMLATHRATGTWEKKIDRYIALTEFARQKFIDGGLPADKIVVKPNFLDPDPGMGRPRGNVAVFVGRLAEQKGLLTLLESWRRLAKPIPLRIIGEGPLTSELKARKEKWGLSSVTLEGRLPRADTIAAIGSSRILIFPSLWYECFPLTLIEAFACGVPVFASRLGAMEEIVQEGRTGTLFRPGDADDLATKIAWAWENPAEIEAMRRACREEYENKYTAAINCTHLMDIYRSVIDRREVAVA